MNTKEYVLTHLDGTRVFHGRVEDPDGSKRFYWRTDTDYGLGGRSVADIDLYGPTPLDYGMVIICEGEKSADALKSIGVPALGTVCGASMCPSLEVLKPLMGFKVYLWPDNDEPGRRHMDLVALALRSIGVSPRLLTWSDAPHHGDAADYVAGGGDYAGVMLFMETARRSWEMHRPPTKQPVRVPTPGYDTYSTARQDWMSRAKAAVNLGELAPPERDGRNTYMIHCPLHDDRVRSLSVDVDKQLWTCFGCSAGGDVIQWLRLVKGMEWKEIIAYLAEASGIPAPSAPIVGVSV